MISGEAATVLRKAKGAPDEMGEPTVTWEAEEVPNCLITQSYEQTGGMSDGTRPEGTEDTATLHVPKDYTAPLAGCRVEMAGRTWEVLGDPTGYMEANTPGAWNRPVQMRKVEG